MREQSEALKEEGNRLAGLGDLAGAIAKYDEATALDPTNPRPLCNKGILSSQLGQLEQAEAAFHQAIAADNAYADAYGGLATMYARADRFQEALEPARQACKHAPRAVEHWCRLGHIYGDLNNEGRAAAAYIRALRLDPDCEQAKIGMAKLPLGTIPDLEEAVDVLGDVLDDL